MRSLFRPPTGGAVALSFIYIFLLGASSAAGEDTATGRGPTIVVADDGKGIPVSSPPSGDLDPKALVRSVAEIPNQADLPPEALKEYKARVAAARARTTTGEMPHEDSLRIYLHFVMERNVERAVRTVRAAPHRERERIVDEIMTTLQAPNAPEDPNDKIEEPGEWEYRQNANSALHLLTSLARQGVLSKAEQAYYADKYRANLQQEGITGEVRDKLVRAQVDGFGDFRGVLFGVQQSPASQANGRVLESLSNLGFFSPEILSDPEHKRYHGQLRRIFEAETLTPQARGVLSSVFLESGNAGLTGAVLSSSNPGLSMEEVFSRLPETMKNDPDVLARLLGRIDSQATYEKVSEALRRISPDKHRRALLQSVGNKTDVQTAALTELLERYPGSLGPEALLKLGSEGKAGTARSVAHHLSSSADFDASALPQSAKAHLRTLLDRLLTDETSPDHRAAGLRLMQKAPASRHALQLVRSLGYPLSHPQFGTSLPGTEAFFEQARKTFESLPLSERLKLIQPLSEMAADPKVHSAASITAADPKVHSAASITAAEYLGQIPTPEALEALLALAENPSRNRLARKAVADGINGIFHGLPAEARKRFEERYLSLFEHEGASDEAHDMTRFLRFGLAPEERQWVDQKTGNLVGNQPNVCEIVCRIYDQSDKWASEKLFSQPDSYFNPDEPKYTWEIATKSLAAVFMLEAAPYCDPQRKKLERVSQWIRTRSSGVPTAAQGANSELSHLRSMLGGDSPAEKAALEFLETAGLGRAAPRSSIEVYGKTFLSLLMRKWKESPANLDVLKKVNGELLRDLAALETTPRQTEGGRNNSLGMLHLHLSSLIAGTFEGAAAQAPLQKQLGLLEAAFQEQYERHKDGEFREEAHFILPYTFTGEHRGGNHPLESRGTVPMAYFALYKHTQDPEKRALYRGRLVESLSLYDRDFWDYFSLAGRKTLPEGFHDRTIGAQIAPYFGPATVPYVAAFTQRILEDPQATDEEKKSVRKTRDSLRAKLASKLKDNGLFVDQDPVGFQSAATYDNPQVGLAFVAMLDPEMDQCRSGGTAKPASGILLRPGTTGPQVPPSARGFEKSH